MADGIKIQPPDPRNLFFRVRGRFLKLQREIVGGAIQEAAKPIIAAARANAPALTGRLRESIGIIQTSKKSAPVVRFAVGPLKRSRKDKRFPYWGLFQERGWKATGRANRKTAVTRRAIPGKHFLKRAGEANFSQTDRIFKQRVIEGFEQIREAAEAAGIVQ